MTQYLNNNQKDFENLQETVAGFYNAQHEFIKVLADVLERLKANMVILESAIENFIVSMRNVELLTSEEDYSYLSKFDDLTSNNNNNEGEKSKIKESILLEKIQILIKNDEAKEFRNIFSTNKLALPLAKKIIKLLVKKKIVSYGRLMVDLIQSKSRKAVSVWWNNLIVSLEDMGIIMMIHTKRGVNIALKD